MISRRINQIQVYATTHDKPVNGKSTAPERSLVNNFQGNDSNNRIKRFWFI